MKLVKLSIVAITLGLFVTSCGSGNAEAPKTDSASATTAAQVAAPAKPDTLNAAPAKPADTTKPATPAQ